MRSIHSCYPCFGSLRCCRYRWRENQINKRQCRFRGSFNLRLAPTIGRLSARVFETQIATGKEHFAYQGSGVLQIFILIICNGEKILVISNANVVVLRQVKRENSSLPVAVRVSKTRLLKLPNTDSYAD